MTSLSYGTVPDREALERRCDDAYPIGNLYPGSSDLATLERVTGHIDSHLESVHFTQDREQCAHPNGVRILIEPGSMHTLLRRLTERWEDGDEEAGDLASSILYTLDFEWV